MLLGLEPDGDDLVVDPHLPDAIGRLAVNRIPGRWGSAEQDDGGCEMSDEQFDLIVLGAGSAARDGAAKTKREYGPNVAMVERGGGSCPNVACRPT